MSKVVIDYDKIDSAISYATRMTNDLLDYGSDLTTFNTGFGSLSGGSSTNTQECEYYVSAKVTEIDNKATKFDDSASLFDLAGKLQTLKDVAQNNDTAVGNLISSAKDQFVEAKHIETSLWTDFTNWLISWTGDIPILQGLGELIDGFFDTVSSAWDSICYWYQCGGGREFIGTVLAVIGAIASIVILVVSCIPPICGIVAVCAIIGAAIAAISAIVNVINSVRAQNSKRNGDLAWSKIYGDQNTVQDWLRQTNFNNGVLNALSYGAALVVDVAEIVCAVVGLVDSVGKFANIFKELKLKAGHSGRGFFKVLKSYVFNVDITGTKAARRNGVTRYGDLIRKYANPSNASDLQKSLKSLKNIASKTKSFTKILDGIRNGDFSIPDITSFAFSFTDFQLPDIATKLRSLKSSLTKLYGNVVG